MLISEVRLTQEYTFINCTRQDLLQKQARPHEGERTAGTHYSSIQSQRPFHPGLCRVCGEPMHVSHLHGQMEFRSQHEHLVATDL